MWLVYVFRVSLIIYQVVVLKKKKLQGFIIIVFLQYHTHHINFGLKGFSINILY